MWLVLVYVYVYMCVQKQTNNNLDLIDSKFVAMDF